MASQEENDLHIVRFHEISICELEVMLYISVGLGHLDIGCDEGDEGVYLGVDQCEPCGPCPS